MRGADALIAALEGAGVDTVFGMPGGANLPLYDALLDSGIRHVLMRHEAGAGHAAEGYARATGRVGVAFATSGPGATNLVTPIATLRWTRSPTLFVTGQVRTALRGHERLPGGGRDRDHGADRQALDRGRAARRRRAGDHRRAAPGARRPARAGAGRRPGRRGERGGAGRRPPAAASRLPAADEAERQAGRPRGAGAGRGAPAGAVRRRRRRPRRGGRRAGRARAASRARR